MAKIYREIEDIQEPTPRPSGDAAVKHPSGEPFNSQSRVEALEGKYNELSGKMEGIEKGVKKIEKKLTEAFSKRKTKVEEIEESDDNEADEPVEDELDAVESTDPMDKGGMKINDADKTKSAAPAQTNFERMSRRRTVVGGSSKESLNVKNCVKEFLKGMGGMM